MLPPARPSRIRTSHPSGAMASGPTGKRLVVKPLMLPPDPSDTRMRAAETRRGAGQVGSQGHRGGHQENRRRIGQAQGTALIFGERRALYPPSEALRRGGGFLLQVAKQVLEVVALP